MQVQTEAPVVTAVAREVPIGVNGDADKKGDERRERLRSPHRAYHSAGEPAIADRTMFAIACAPLASLFPITTRTYQRSG